MTSPPPLDPCDLPGPNGEHLTDPIECLQAASAKFKRHFRRPPEHHGPLHDNDADWTTALLSRDTFRAKIAHLQIPTHLTNLIWESLTNVPNIQAGREQLHTVFTQPPTYEDYLHAIKSHKKTLHQASPASPTDTSKHYRMNSTKPPMTCSAPYGQPNTSRTIGNNDG